MKITLTLLCLTALTAVLGMFYWMYKSKQGTLNLSSKSWHFKLLAWMWDTDESDVHNACPYYWGLVSSLIILPMYLFVRFIILPLTKLYDKYKPKNKIKLPKLNIPTVNIPETKKEAFKLLAKKSKKWLLYGFIGLFCIIALIGLIISFITDWKRTLLGLCLVISAACITGVIVYLIDESPSWLDDITEPFIDLGRGFYGLVKLPFMFSFYLLSLFAKKVFKIYSDNCPEVVWDKD